LGVDPSPHNVRRAAKAIADAQLAGRLEVIEGRIEAIATADASFDFVWCRDVLVHVANLVAAFRESARVLRRAGAMLIFQTFATELLEPLEAERLFAALAVVPGSTSVAHFEAAIEGSGLAIEECDVIGSEWREHREENGEGYTSKQLLRIARIRRDK